jgi:lipopolysaccharide export system protein LptA
MSVKVPIRTVFDGSTATGLAEYQSGEFIGLTHGGLGASLSIGSAGQVLKVNSGGSALEFGSVEAIVNIDNATDLTSNTLATSDLILVSDGGTEGRATLSQVATAILAAPTITGTAVMADLDISGDVDVDGTLEADAITVNGATLTETITDLVGGMVSSNTETGITVTFQDADNTLDFALGATQTTITSLLATDIKIGEDDQTKIDFETADEIHFYAANAEQVFVSDGVFGPQTDSDVDLGTTGVRWKDAYIDTVTTTGNVTVGGDLTITGDDLVMGTNTSGHILVADGTNFNPTAVTDLSEISTVASGDTLLAVDASGGGLKKITRATLVSGLATSSAISNLSEDITPQLGGDLDVQTNSIVSTSNRNIAITPNGTGVVNLDGTEVSDGLIELKTGTGSVAKIKFYCESGNAHAQTLQAAPHSAASSAVLVLPTASGTLLADDGSGNVTISGNLTVNGTTTTVNSTTVTIDDPIFTLGGDSAPGSDDNKDRGIEFRYHDGSAARLGFFGFDDSAGAFTFLTAATNSSEVFSGTIGNVTAGIGTFASLDISGNVDVDGTLETDALSIASTTVTATATELNFVDGVTSAIQTQLDTKTTATAAADDATALSIALG